MPTDRTAQDKPLVLITGAAGNLGRSIAKPLVRGGYRIVGVDRVAEKTDFPIVEADLTAAESIADALDAIRAQWGDRLASVLHLAAYFDFTGEAHPLYDTLNVEGSRMLVRALAERFTVEQIVFSSTMLVHAPARPGERIDEGRPIDPRWAYPRSKAAAERAIEEEAGSIPTVMLRLAGVYDEQSAVPTLSHQIARIYERKIESHLYSGDSQAGQSMLHRNDMIDAFRRTVDRRRALPARSAILIGEPEAPSYAALQDEIGYLVHGRERWPTMRVPKPVAAAGAWAQEKLEPVIPDAIDKGEEPFVKPFMVRMADDNYALDIGRARDLLGWSPEHRLKDVLPAMIGRLKRNPAGWYEANGITPPEWIEEAVDLGLHPEGLRERHEAQAKRQYGDFRWTHFLNIALGSWLVVQPPLIGLDQPWLARTEVALGAALMLFATLALSWRMRWARWICAGIGILVMAVPFTFWTSNAASYLSDTLVGMLAFGLALSGRPEPGVSPAAALTGPETPPGWDYNPSSWAQRLPIILLAIIGLYVSRWLAAYQLGQIDGVWEPFFAGSLADPRNGTEEIITSRVSEAFPVPDAALGGWLYALEVVTGVIGSRLRWRTMPWLVILFGFMIAPLGIVSISFIIIQPIVIGTWSTLTLIAAAAMLIQIPYSLDELLASLQFIRRRIRAGQNWLRVLLTGDTDEGDRRTTPEDEFHRSAGAVVAEMTSGGVNLPWNLAACVAIGIWLMFTRIALGADGWLANSDHLIGSLVLTVVSVAAAEVARPVRLAILPLGAALLVTPFILDADPVGTIGRIVAGLALTLLCLRRGSIHNRYGCWSHLLK